MRVCTEKSTGKLIESQSGGRVKRLPQNNKVSDLKYTDYLNDCDTLEANRLDTLKQNAVNAGYIETNIEVKYISNIEYQIILDAQSIPEKTEREINEAKIKTKIRKLAIVELIKEKTLPANYI